MTRTMETLGIGELQLVESQWSCKMRVEGDGYLLPSYLVLMLAQTP